jgi:hypothetical protein
MSNISIGLPTLYYIRYWFATQSTHHFGESVTTRSMGHIPESKTLAREYLHDPNSKDFVGAALDKDLIAPTKITEEMRNVIHR